MSNLSDFPAPSAHLPTICERNSKLINECNANIIDYRRIDLTDSNSNRKSLSCLESVCKPAFVNYEESLLDKIRSNWHAGGLTRVFDELNKSDEVPAILQTLSQSIYNGLKVLYNCHQKMFPTKIHNTRNKQTTLLACHPHIAKIAVALKDNTVKIISLNGFTESNQEVLLKDKRIQKVTCLSWRPKSSMSIAVGSSKGILVWLLDPNVNSTRPGSNMTRFLHSKDIATDISSITWSSDGKLLACSCLNSTSFWIWDILSQRCTPIHRVGSATSFLTWSPCGQRLLAANQAETFRVWETSTWTCEKWADLNGTCTNACWSTCGSYLLFTVANEPVIYYVHFQNFKNSSNIDISGSGVALKCADVSKCMWNDDIEEVGGAISNMVWDPTNSRLAVTFEGSLTNQPYIALYHTRITPLLQLVPCGFIRGEDHEMPLNINFIHGYDKGAMLSVYWSSETISLIPLLYNQTLSQSPRHYIVTNQSGAIDFNRTFDEIANLSTMQNETALYSTVDA